jgi:hypothetical protein
VEVNNCTSEQQNNPHEASDSDVETIVALTVVWNWIRVIVAVGQR